MAATDVDKSQLDTEVCIIKWGTYTGNGADGAGQGITGVGFQPAFVKIWWTASAESAHDDVPVEKHSGWGIYALCHRTTAGTEHQTLDNKIISLDSDGFTVSDDSVDGNPNANTIGYTYMAMANAS